MKNKVALLFAIIIMTTAFGQEDNLPQKIGDNFSLEGALALFKISNSLSNFEKRINSKGNNINNLDLNNDGYIDFINVDEIKSDGIHVIILSTNLSNTEKQDIATITLQKTADAEAVIQIEGDKSLYPENTIVEPIAENETPQNSKIVNVWFWPSVHYIYAPNYIVRTSPYYWENYPKWWQPWYPNSYSNFYVGYSPHRLSYRPVATRRIVAGITIYAPIRHFSTLVIYNRRNHPLAHQGTRVNIVSTNGIRGNYRRVNTIRVNNFKSATRAIPPRGAHIRIPNNRVKLYRR